ncbi:MAG TPA: monovalent cation/H+ antiporter subunit D [Trueperaceae bacterium]|nr:monovalent cation/H+ antiporter subunit D [Trueperaceae bacterium]
MIGDLVALLGAGVGGLGGLGGVGGLGGGTVAGLGGPVGGQLINLSPHLPILPIVVPLVAAAIMLLLDERVRNAKAIIGSLTTLALVIVSLMLVRTITGQGADGVAQVLVYRLGDWAAPFGIVLVVDRLAALMVLVTSVLGFAAFLYSLARWAIVGPRFHSLFLLLLMGLNGAFLTGDLFNLYVFFEVLLAASYGLLLHASGRARVRAGLQYIAINLASSMVFLIGVGLMYSVTGTLNMADLAAKAATLGAGDLALYKAGFAILVVAFLTKAGMWPLSFWLPTAYSAASPPAAAIFAVMTKVGVYVTLRMLMLASGSGDATGIVELISPWLLVGGIATIVYGSVGVLSSRELPRLAAYSTLISSGTLLAAFGTADERVIGASLYYLVASTLAVGAAFLLAEPIARRKEVEAVQVVEPVFGDDFETNLRSEFEGYEVGVVIPASTALLGGAFVVCALVLIGLPPLAGFVAKLGIMSGVLAHETAVSALSWVLVSVMVFSSLAMLLAFVRKGIEAFWLTGEETTAEVGSLEAIPIGLLLAICMAITLAAGPSMRYIDLTSAELTAPTVYSEAVLGEQQ